MNPEANDMPATSLRRVVTGVAHDGRSTVHGDGLASCHYQLQTLGGLTATAIWETTTPLTGIPAGGDPSGPLTLQPPAGSLRFFKIVFPPDAAVSEDQEAIIAELGERAPSFFEAVSPDKPFPLHRTDTIDIAYIVSGAIDLVLETGPVSLQAGDSIVQQGTWHGWSNTHDEPCVMIVAMLRTSAAAA
jgi:mannose-6-phosphate isomerase-like protein (cupin superfamily)